MARGLDSAAPDLLFVLPQRAMAKDSPPALAVETSAVRSSLETVCRSSDLSHFATADLAIAAADFADFAGSFRSAGSARIGPHRRLRSSLFSAAVEAEGSASGLGSASAS